jgi:hypothetical protein
VVLRLALAQQLGHPASQQLGVVSQAMPVVLDQVGCRLPQGQGQAAHRLRDGPGGRGVVLARALQQEPGGDLQGEWLQAQARGSQRRPGGDDQVPGQTWGQPVPHRLLPRLVQVVEHQQPALVLAQPAQHRLDLALLLLLLLLALG